MFLRHIRAIGAENPILKPIQRESQKQVPEEAAPEETFPVLPGQEEEPPPDPTEAHGRKTGFDHEPLDFMPPSENSEVTAAEQKAIEELIRIIEEYEASINSQSVPSAAVEGRVADLEPSIEERPNRVESYLKLARAYQQAGEDEKASEMYHRAREWFPDDERVQREAAAYRNKRGRSTQHGDEDEHGSYSDEDASEEDEER